MNLDTLGAQLNASEEELKLLSPLTDEQKAKLSAQLSTAKAVQHKHVSDAFYKAVEQLPRLMRKPVLKMFEDLL